MGFNDHTSSSPFVAFNKIMQSKVLLSKEVNYFARRFCSQLKIPNFIVFKNYFITFSNLSPSRED